MEPIRRTPSRPWRGVGSEAGRCSTRSLSWTATSDPWPSSEPTARAAAVTSAPQQWNEATAEPLGQQADRYLALAAAVSSGALGPEDHSGLEFGLNCILDGIDALIAEQDGH